MPDKVGLESHEQTSLRGIAEKAEYSKSHCFQNLYQLLDAPFLMVCWLELNKNAASGVDNVTAEVYQANLVSNIQSLSERLKAKTYRSKLVRRCYIPKENGKERPLGIPALEDKLVQIACAKVLGAIFEFDFLDNSYGYRPNRSAKGAIQVLIGDLNQGIFGYVVEADIKGFFDNMDHNWLLEMLNERIDDKAFLNLIQKMVKGRYTGYRWESH